MYVELSDLSGSLFFVRDFLIKSLSKMAYRATWNILCFPSIYREPPRTSAQIS